jgi:hypothetical protein
MTLCRTVFADRPLFRSLTTKSFPRDRFHDPTARWRTSIFSGSPAANTPPMLVVPVPPCPSEHEYSRCGAWAYIVALDVHHARIFGRCETKNGIAPFDRLVDQVMTRPPYKRRPPCVLDRRQLLRPPWIQSRTTIAGSLSALGSRPRARPCQLVESGRDLFLHPATQGSLSK